MNLFNVISRNSILLIVAFLVSGIETGTILAAEPSFYVDKKYFDGLEGCFIAYDLTNNKTLAIYGEDYCQKQMPACSTFKWPLAAIAFDAGILKEETTSMKWDGVKRPIASWNRDQTALTWMQNSVVWYSQQITRTLGKEKLQSDLDRFNYGNRDLSAGLTSAWLTITKTDADPSKGSLKVSALEQLDFLKKFWKGQLSVSTDAIEKTKRITFLEKTTSGFDFHGKTGSGYLDGLAGDFGWFIGHIRAKDREVLVVTRFTRDQRSADATFPGLKARELSKVILKDNALW